jgi:hypothetical protein
LYGLGMPPLLFGISLLLFYFHAALILGWLPTYGMPDPKVLGIYPGYALVIHVTFTVWMCSSLTWLVSTLAYVITKRKKINWKPVILGSLTHASAVFLLFSRAMEWFVD